jgi:hypothetical protein
MATSRIGEKFGENDTTSRAHAPSRARARRLRGGHLSPSLVFARENLPVLTRSVTPFWARKASSTRAMRMGLLLPLLVGCGGKTVDGACKSDQEGGWSCTKSANVASPPEPVSGCQASLQPARPLRHDDAIAATHSLRVAARLSSLRRRYGRTSRTPSASACCGSRKAFVSSSCSCAPASVEKSIARV